MNSIYLSLSLSLSLGETATLPAHKLIFFPPNPTAACLKHSNPLTLAATQSNLNLLITKHLLTMLTQLIVLFLLLLTFTSSIDHALSFQSSFDFAAPSSRYRGPMSTSQNPPSLCRTTFTSTDVDWRVATACMGSISTANSHPLPCLMDPSTLK